MTLSDKITTPFQQGSVSEEARLLFEHGKYSEVIALHQKALQYQMNDFAIWAHLGVALREIKRHAASAGCLKRAIELSPKSYSILKHYALSLVMLNRKEEALKIFDDLLQVLPNNFLLRAHYAFALRELDMHEKALVQYEAACALDPENIEAKWDVSKTYLSLGRYKEGWKDYEVRWRLDKKHGLSSLIDEEKSYTSIRWQGEDLKDKTILIYADHGLGDTILFSRYIPLVAASGARVLLKCSPTLHRLLHKIRGLYSFVQDMAVDKKIDYHVPIMSLAAIFGTEIDSIPSTPSLYVSQDLPEEVIRKLNLGQDRFKIGIVWSGNPDFAANYKRSAAFAHFMKLTEVSNVQLYSLQKGQAEQELVDNGAQGLVIELGPHLRDFADTAAVLEKLDLVIMTDSSVAHLAGSIGCPIWNLLCNDSYWLYMTQREDSPWYHSMRLFRQPSPGNWDSVFKEVVSELEKLVTQHQQTKK